MPHIDIKPKMFRWALERVGHDPEALPEILTQRFPKLPDWVSGDGKGPTLIQLERFAEAVQTTAGYLMLQEPPDDRLKIPDFRTFDDHAVSRPSPNLLDTLYACEDRQDWYRGYAVMNGFSELSFIGSVEIKAAEDESSVEQVAADIRSTLGFELESRKECKTSTEALQFLIQQAEEARILVMVSGVVKSDTSRKLDVEEFRSFALVDRWAPLIFINDAASKSEQMFTLAHELTHLWLNATGLSNAGAHPLPELASTSSSTHPFLRQEVWCNKVAAELLVPMDALTEQLKTEESIEDAMERLARHFKVSMLVMLRRLLDAKWLSKADFEDAWNKEQLHPKQVNEKSVGEEDFYKTTAKRVSHRFARALISDTLAGKMLYRDAFWLFGVNDTQSLKGIGREVGLRNESLFA